jgi:ribosomal-protein-alanine N-acetyltransferase
MIRQMLREARAGRSMPFVVTYDDVMCGQVFVNGIVWGSSCSASIGYWISRDHAGRGIIPVAVALVIDHALTTAGLHRIEIAIRPENIARLRVVENLGVHRIGMAPRYLHIDGAWRDHELYAVTAEELTEPLISRLRTRHET